MDLGKNYNLLTASKYFQQHTQEICDMNKTEMRG